MLDQINPARVLYLDIETAAGTKTYEDLTPALQHLWDERFKNRLKDGETCKQYYEREAGLHAEFSRVVCVCVGKFTDKELKKFEVCPYRNEDEKALLTELAELIERLPEDVYIASHNGFEFDWPTLCRRMVVHGISVPKKLWDFDQKPWLMRLIDTMSVWKFGQRHHYCKLDLMANLLGIPSSKDDIEGKDVSLLYWAGELSRIVKYCGKDVVVLANVILRLKGMPILNADSITTKE